METIKENESLLLYTVKDNNLTLKKLLKDEIGLSGRYLSRLSKTESILVNNKAIPYNTKLKKGDLILIQMEDEQEPNPPEEIPISIIYEDHDLLIVNKQPGIVVHPTKNHESGTIANGVAHYFHEHQIRKKIRFVNRLDMDTSGLLVIAKNPYGQHQMGLQFNQNTVEKRYLTLVDGVLEKEKGLIEAPIGRDEKDPIRQIVTPFGKESVTKYKVAQRYPDATLVEIQIITGRSHQIRVHMKHLGHPVIGDTLYNQPSPIINRQALHSSSLTFKKIRSGERVEVHAELPDDMKCAIKHLS